MTERQKQFQRNEKLEELLLELNGMLAPAEIEVAKKFKAPRYPVILLVGCARSGTTLLMQWLASIGEFAYPTNFLSRFYAAPYIGARIQQMLSAPQYYFRDEMSDFGSEFSFQSNLGKTTGVLAPNDFYYFWRRFFPYGEIQYLDNKLLKQVETAGFLSELSAIESVFDKPFAMKGLLINWNIPFIDSLFERMLFIHVKRHPHYNAQSLLEARERFFGDRKQWYSLKPREYYGLEKLDPFQQVAGQVFYTKRAIENGLNQVNTSRYLKITYDDFCESPRAVYDRIAEKLDFQEYSLRPIYQGPQRFESTDIIRIPSENFKKIKLAYEKFSRSVLKGV